MKTLQSLVFISTLLIGATPLFAEDAVDRALHHLREARHELEHAEFHKPGPHRERALEKVDAAIQQIEESRR